ncbi:Rrf2 family transcriptional regulator [Aliiroseovarius sp. Z3]|uniref:RrF2 family transcriptional regulator n=1 Tax=Aliiroseovarius sp. Z3 TaxID=2811402 RepID=UPI0023B2EDCC|nr:Rrf2 family transcriptional regulator [Aliiroseovarius sp. Z3]MDE9451889.1 Rrf2 family transcriptional regulator [Aliiroseovarius sp. Z3]MDE9452047.1 Rrf2 family transcriptional regulator [Aliiroseovarius sp. Z3]
MPTDNRLPRVLHVLLHLDEIKDPVTSDMLGQMLGMNPSLVRRTMAGLREAGMVSSTKGHGGGWHLTKSLDEISLADVYAALGTPNLFALGPAGDTPDCLLERAANEAVAGALDAARTEFESRIANVTVAQLFQGPRKEVAKHQAKRDRSSHAV